MIELLEFDVHRNGSGGESFAVAKFMWDATKHEPLTFIAMATLGTDGGSHSEEVPGNTCVICLDIDTIAFGQNSWRGHDRIGPSMREWHRVWSSFTPKQFAMQMDDRVKLIKSKARVV